MPTHPVPDAAPSRRFGRPPTDGSFDAERAREALVRRWAPEARIDQSIRTLVQHSASITDQQLDRLGALLRSRRAA